MKNKKAFTLAELLAVIVILGILVTITVPIVTNQINSYRQKLCNTQYNNILNAARAYGADNLENISDGSTVTLGTLQSEGYIEENIDNPVTKETISSSLNINISNVGTNNKIKYTYSFDKDIDSYCTSD